MFAAADILTLFSEKNQKPNLAHKCPITSIQIRTESQKLSEFSCICESVWGPKVCCVGKMQYAELICTNPVLYTSDAQNTTYVSLSKVVRKLVRQSL